MVQSGYLEEQLVSMLAERNYFITTAESLTGGAIAASLVNVAGASGVLKEAYVTYCDEAKIKLANVPEEILKTDTAVSAECASAMAEGIRLRAGADVAISATGLAGPGGGSEKFPVGLVFIGCSVRGRVETRRLLLTGDRNEIRKNTVQKAIKLAISCLCDENCKKAEIN
jgi:nicotinamide-nucleotide amidase